MTDTEGPETMSTFEFDKGENAEIEAPEAEAAAPAPLRPDEPVDEAKAPVVAALRSVFDPEIPVNIYDLGLIYGIDLSNEGKHVDIRMTLTAPGCPVAGEMPAMVAHAIRGAMPTVEEVDVELVWDPPWTPENLSEAARLELGMF